MSEVNVSLLKSLLNSDRLTEEEAVELRLIIDRYVKLDQSQKRIAGLLKNIDKF